MKTVPGLPRNGRTAPAGSNAGRTRTTNHLKDEVYREMLLLEMNRPGAEMGLALALLRAVVDAGSSPKQSEFSAWLKTICPVGLRMIEAALAQGDACDPNQGEAS